MDTRRERSRWSRRAARTEAVTAPRPPWLTAAGTCFSQTARPRSLWRGRVDAGVLRQPRWRFPEVWEIFVRLFFIISSFHMTRRKHSVNEETTRGKHQSHDSGLFSHAPD